MSILVGVDLGGTSTKVLLAEEADGVLVERRSTRWPTARGDGALQALTTALATWVGDERPDRVGVSVPGVLDPAGRALTVSVNLPWLVGARVADALAAPFGAAGALLNDGESAARAEVVLGAARGVDDAFVIALGTGVAGAHVVAGELRRGAHGAAGEIGHVATGTGPRCSCGQRGCLETSIGGAQLAARWAQLTGRPPGSCTTLDVVEAARSGDAPAVDLLDRATDHLAAVLLGAVALIDPGVVVIGGGLGQATDVVVEPTVRKLAASATFHHLPSVLPAALGPWAGAWGAVLAARETHHDVHADRGARS